MKSARVRLYHKDCPKGQIFTDSEALDKAIADGWVDFPTKINQVSETAQSKPKTAQQIADEEMAKIDWGDKDEAKPPPIEEPAKLKPWEKALAARKAKRVGGNK